MAKCSKSHAIVTMHAKIVAHAMPFHDIIRIHNSRWTKTESQSGEKVAGESPGIVDRKKCCFWCRDAEGVHAVEAFCGQTKCGVLICGFKASQAHEERLALRQLAMPMPLPSAMPQLDWPCQVSMAETCTAAPEIHVSEHVQRRHPSFTCLDEHADGWFPLFYSSHPHSLLLPPFVLVGWPTCLSFSKPKSVLAFQDIYFGDIDINRFIYSSMYYYYGLTFCLTFYLTKATTEAENCGCLLWPSWASWPS